MVLARRGKKEGRVNWGGALVGCGRTTKGLSLSLMLSGMKVWWVGEGGALL